MAKLGVVLALFSLLATIPWTQSFKVENWATMLESQKKTVTSLQFYFHDIVSGKNPSAVRVAKANDTDKSPTFFGALTMADDPLTETPDPKSNLVGRAQGLYGSAGQQELGFLMAMNFAFTDGVYNGSSVSLLGRNSPLHPIREMPIVGGTGMFRLARGYAIAQTHQLDPTGDAIVHYNVTVVH
ncbi:Dirigent protein 23 [Morella rubra]|uniref:Dirigent protein n=1 Tax=Morella rubra TaxID=262757 RepID=A0A6A1V6E6_9ROSI|nr:Dirigent protein 23 [Morella rubra]